MKKTYIQPSIEAVKIQTTTILAGSEKFAKKGVDYTGEVTICSQKGGYGYGEMGEIED